MSAKPMSRAEIGAIKDGVNPLETERLLATVDSLQEECDLWRDVAIAAGCNEHSYTGVLPAKQLRDEREGGK